MTGVEIALIGFALMLIAIFLRVPIAVAMGITGFVGIWVMRGSAAAPLSQLKTLGFDTFSSYSLSIVPMFLLMGQFATKSGMSRALFQAAADWLGHRRGGIAMATVGACAGFGAICGSSLATASTMGQVALPEMRRAGYSDRLATGVLAAGGTLGILIPPSVILVIYAILAEQNIAKMFSAAIVPGILAALGYMITVRVMAGFDPAHVEYERAPISARLRSLVGIWPVIAIFALVMGGIAADWNWSKEGVQALFTPTEGAAVGMILTGLYGALRGDLTRAGFVDSLLEAASATAMIFLILLGAQLFNSFLAFTQAPQMLAQWIAANSVAPLAVLLAMLLFYLIFGCVMDSLSMILLTIPIFFPIIETLDFGLGAEGTAIWFGILALITVEVGLITPPVGLNLFIINGLSKDTAIGETYRGVLPFIATDILRVALILLVPSLALWLV
ncbi:MULTISPECIES: TRAP transporter large permease [Halocynthiibacter]|uniref:TRAP transporter large permease protein n=1 Tax=Halocynthiibacter halioticoli TaxID=2986804 RepID=A0AAE3LUI9_9RHOB|nr:MULTISPECIES: TRAP transporter large permease [Halocynthiibacter]MCV6824340.1 TRAP transporter large permease [Halocynthiibacter halioticoli]MCW4057341.1 TRAP transporter large permease [Halocynthiibacter sp. SDUM655004]